MIIFYIISLLKIRRRFESILIYKQELANNTGVEEVELHFENAEEARKNILHLELQYDRPMMWFNAVREKTKKFMIICIGTGHDWGDELLREKYIGCN